VVPWVPPIPSGIYRILRICTAPVFGPTATQSDRLQYYVNMQLLSCTFLQQSEMCLHRYTIWWELIREMERTELKTAKIEQNGWKLKVESCFIELDELVFNSKAFGIGLNTKQTQTCKDTRFVIKLIGPEWCNNWDVYFTGNCVKHTVVLLCLLSCANINTCVPCALVDYF